MKGASTRDWLLRNEVAIVTVQEHAFGWYHLLREEERHRTNTSLTTRARTMPAQRHVFTAAASLALLPAADGLAAIHTGEWVRDPPTFFSL